MQTVHSIILDQFARHGSQGLELVRLRRYTLHDSNTGKDAKWSIPFYQTARPGQTFDMSIVFRGDWSVGDVNSGLKIQMSM